MYIEFHLGGAACHSASMAEIIRCSIRTSVKRLLEMHSVRGKRRNKSDLEIKLRCCCRRFAHSHLLSFPFCLIFGRTTLSAEFPSKIRKSDDELLCIIVSLPRNKVKCRKRRSFLLPYRGLISVLTQKFTASKYSPFVRNFYLCSFW